MRGPTMHSHSYPPITSNRRTSPPHNYQMSSNRRTPPPPHGYQISSSRRTPPPHGYQIASGRGLCPTPPGVSSRDFPREDHQRYRAGENSRDGRLDHSREFRNYRNNDNSRDTRGLYELKYLKVSCVPSNLFSIPFVLATFCRYYWLQKSDIVRCNYI